MWRCVAAHILVLTLRRSSSPWRTAGEEVQINNNCAANNKDISLEHWRASSSSSSRRGISVPAFVRYWLSRQKSNIYCRRRRRRLVPVVLAPRIALFDLRVRYRGRSPGVSKLKTAQFPSGSCVCVCCLLFFFPLSICHFALEVFIANVFAR